jgi:hypothetical protein
VSSSTTLAEGNSKAASRSQLSPSLFAGELASMTNMPRFRADNDRSIMASTSAKSFAASRVTR